MTLTNDHHPATDHPTTGDLAHHRSSAPSFDPMRSSSTPTLSLRLVTALLAEAEYLLLEQWTTHLAEPDSHRIDSIVRAHRSVQNARTALELELPIATYASRLGQRGHATTSA